jgi:chemotaxis protein MotA
MAFFGEIARFFDFLSLLIVIGGTALAAAARSSREDMARAFAALGPLVHARPDLDRRAAMLAVGRIEALAEVRSIACADRVQTAEPFLRRAARRLADAATPEDFARWGREELDRRRRRHEGAIGLWRAAADSAPAMGMIGTIIGLVQMFAAMDDAARIGPAMALALLTTLYGVIVSSALAGPIAARLERLSEAELAWQALALERLERLAHAELDTRPLRPRAMLRTVP